MHALLHSVPSALQQVTTNPCLHWRLLDTLRQVWVSLLWGHCSFLLGPGVHTILFVPSKSLFSQSCVISGRSMVGLMAASTTWCSQIIITKLKIINEEQATKWRKKHCINEVINWYNIFDTFLKSVLSKIVLSVLRDMGEEGEIARGEAKARQGNGRWPHPWRLSGSLGLI